MATPPLLGLPLAPTQLRYRSLLPLGLARGALGAHPALLAPWSLPPGARRATGAAGAAPAR